MLAALLPLLEGLLAGGAGGAGVAGAAGGAAAGAGTAGAAAGATEAGAAASAAANVGRAAGTAATEAAPAMTTRSSLFEFIDLLQGAPRSQPERQAEPKAPPVWDPNRRPPESSRATPGTVPDARPAPPRATPPTPPPPTPKPTGGGGGGSLLGDLLGSLGKGGAAGALASGLSGGEVSLPFPLGTVPDMSGTRHQYAQQFGGDVGAELHGKMMEAAEAFKEPLGPLKFAMKEMVSLPITIKRWGDSLLESQQHLVAFNSKIAGAYGEAERRDILRNVESGATTSSSTESLAEAMSDFNDELQPFKDMVTNGLNTLVTTGVQAVTTLIQVAKVVAPGYSLLKGIHDYFYKLDDAELSRYGTLMDDIRSGKLPNNKHTKTPPKK